MSSKFTQDYFLSRAKSVHGDLYDYSKAVYTKNHTPLDIICKIHGIFSQTPHSHLCGSSCNKCAIDKRAKKKILPKEKFIIEATKIHNGKYDYSKIEYVKASSKIKIICPLHGSFTQMPSAHLIGYGCQNCSKKSASLSQRLTNEIFIKTANKIYNNFYDYSKVNYETSHSKVSIMCPIHGEFCKTPANHTHKTRPQGCPICGSGKSYKNSAKPLDIYISQVNKIHNFKYNYNEVKYINDFSKINIICPLHGLFVKNAGKHLQGQGCPICSREVNTFKKLDWVKKGVNKEGVFYIIKCSNNKEEFYKIGITFNSVKQRYSTSQKMPYNYEIIQEIKSFDLNYIWDLEVYFKKFINSQKLHYTPQLYFKGHKYECFKPN